MAFTPLVMESSLTPLSFTSWSTCDSSVIERLLDTTEGGKDRILEHVHSVRTFDGSLRAIPLIQHCPRLRLSLTPQIHDLDFTGDVGPLVGVTCPFHFPQEVCVFWVLTQVLLTH